MDSRSRLNLFKYWVRSPVLHHPQLPLLSAITMLIRRPQTSSWKQPNPMVPDPSHSPLSPKRWLDQDSGAVGLGIVAALQKSIISTAPVAITSLRPAGNREESRQHGHKNRRWREEELLCGSSARSSKKKIIIPALPMPDFLSNCCLCRTQLHGKDVYMYQEEAFCSMECRYQQMVSDELQEKSGRSKMCKTSDMSCSPCSSNGRLFFTSIVAA